MSLEVATAPQHEQALAMANEVRRLRGLRRQQIAGLSRKDGALTVIAVLLDAPQELRTVSVGWLLRCIHGCAEDCMETICRPLRLRSNKPLHELTNRQRGLLTGALEVRYGLVDILPAAKAALRYVSPMTQPGQAYMLRWRAQS